ncbi:zinc finger domain-containing protein [Ruminococcus flavefaciens]|uniref:zinc finger domain-containing protein n=1 Tax=Ruminococcus flavefaciens TaxID=1265 RepID=UPI000944F01B|nr:zinc finger domain-containing protein [Ruminococcus flavefaciens]
MKAIIERTKDMCNLIWLENLSLRRSYKADILSYIKEKYPHLMPIYDEIYNCGSLFEKIIVGGRSSCYCPTCQK